MLYFIAIIWVFFTKILVRYRVKLVLYANSHTNYRDDFRLPDDFASSERDVL
jgi:hypothetical protein